MSIIKALSLGVMRDAAGEGSDAGAGGGEDEAAKAAAAAAAAAAAEAAAKEADKGAGGEAGEGDKTPTDSEAKLLKEVMEKKKALKDLEAKLKTFEGIDPAKVKELLDGEVKREQARKKAEQTALEAKGDFDRVKAMMAEEHKRQLEEAKAQAKANEDALAAARSQIDDLTVGVNFSNSKFVKDELVLTAAKARALYGSHFALEDGKPVAYDKPVNAKERTKLVDASGDPLSFEAALAKIVEADPDRDTLKRSKLATGAGSGTTKVRPTETKPVEGGGLARIQAALAARNKK